MKRLLGCERKALQTLTPKSMGCAFAKEKAAEADPDEEEDVKALLDSLPEQHPGHQALWYNKNL